MIEILKILLRAEVLAGLGSMSCVQLDNNAAHRSLEQHVLRHVGECERRKSGTEFEVEIYVNIWYRRTCQHVMPEAIITKLRHSALSPPEVNALSRKSG